MAVLINEELAALLSKEDTVKLLVTTDEQGAPHAVVKKSLQLDEQNHFIYFELLESSHTNKNMVRSIWFNRPVTVAVAGANGGSYQIKGRPLKTIVSGPAFRKYYEQVRRENSEADLAAVWVIEPQEIVDQGFSVRRQQEEAKRPYFKHLDRLAKY
ncbi:hypothetical protein HSX37_01870|uniref:Pyridoxamine 5'-phosphate oxidase n=1 Tax=Dendrosporobacter quercicolus TaxID=146817 RepID=A0A1G9LR41_9FIRM|nr:hypothetical protein [Dendrosporobacter quercicolus]NSL46803.1 hypothetical protein [Dendrosporobacter quercicolus DSM 1736]SDL64429.1 hypothetical protein SAMN04488502_101442 [Dendrosporobacter quercicolus]